MAEDNIFKVDPIRTDLTAPVANVVVQQPLDTSANEQRLSSGLSDLSDSFTRLARTKQADQIHNDTITAELAAAYEKEMPGGLEPEAQLAYHKFVDRITKGRVIQQMQDFLLIEGSDILSDNRTNRKTRATSFKNQLLGILNQGKASISRVNAREMFLDMDTMFNQVMGKANVLLAKDKKQETMATAANSFRQLFKEHLAFALELMPKVSDTDELGNELSPSQYAEKLSKFHAGWTAKHINSKWFNSAVVEISRTNLGVDIKDIKATALTIVGDELIKMIGKNPELVNEGMMRDIISNVKGSTKDVTLRDEIDSQSDFGKVLETINNDYNKGVKATLKDLETKRTNNEKARDDRISNYVMDGLLKNDERVNTREKAEALAASINDPSEQRAVLKFIDTFFKKKHSKNASHPEFSQLIQEGADKYYNVETDKFDEMGFRAYAAENGFNPETIKLAVNLANPKTKRGKRRAEFMAQEPIVQLKKNFGKAAEGVLKQYNLLDKYNKLAERFGDKKVVLSDPLIQKKLGLKGEVGLKIRALLDAEVAFGSILEDLIRNNPDVPVYSKELISEAKNQAQALIDNLVGIKRDDKKTSVDESGKSEVKTTGEKIQAGQNQHSTELTTIEPVAIINSKKGLFSTDPEAKKDYVQKATDELKAFDEKKKEIVKLQKEFKEASYAKRAAMITSIGDNPFNLRVPTKIREIAEISNPDPTVRRHLATLKIAGATEIQQPMELQEPSAWDKFVDFFDVLPKQLNKDLQEASKAASKAIQPTAKKATKGVKKALDVIKGPGLGTKKAEGAEAPKKIAVKPDKAKGAKSMTLAQAVADDEGFSRELIDAIIQEESSGISGIVNPKSGAKGLVQIHTKKLALDIVDIDPSKFKGKTREEKAQNILDNDEDNIRAGILLFKSDQDRFKKQGVDHPMKFAMAKYNMSNKAFNTATNKAKKDGKNPNIFSDIFPYFPKATQKYVQNIIDKGVLQ